MSLARNRIPYRAGTGLRGGIRLPFVRRDMPAGISGASVLK